MLLEVDLNFHRCDFRNLTWFCFLINLNLGKDGKFPKNAKFSLLSRLLKFMKLN